MFRIILKAIKMELGGEFIQRKLNVEMGDESREVTHFQYLGWPNYGVPESPDGLASFV